MKGIDVPLNGTKYSSNRQASTRIVTSLSLLAVKKKSNWGRNSESELKHCLI